MPSKKLVVTYLVTIHLRSQFFMVPASGPSSDLSFKMYGTMCSDVKICFGF